MAWESSKHHTYPIPASDMVQIPSSQYGYLRHGAKTTQNGCESTSGSNTRCRRVLCIPFLILMHCSHHHHHHHRRRRSHCIARFAGRVRAWSAANHPGIPSKQTRLPWLPWLPNVSCIPAPLSDMGTEPLNFHSTHLSTKTPHIVTCEDDGD